MGNSRDGNAFTDAVNGRGSLDSVSRAFDYLKTQDHRIELFTEHQSALADVLNNAAEAAKDGHASRVENYLMLAQGIMEIATTTPGRTGGGLLNTSDSVNHKTPIQIALDVCMDANIKNTSIIKQFDKFISQMAATKGVLVENAFRSMQTPGPRNEGLVKELLKNAIENEPANSAIFALSEMNAKNPTLVAKVLKDNAKLLNNLPRVSSTSNPEKAPLLVRLASGINSSDPQSMENATKLLGAVTNVKGVNLNIKSNGGKGDTAFSVLFAQGVNQNISRPAQVTAQVLALQLKQKGVQLTGAAYEEFIKPRTEAENDQKREAMMWFTKAVLPRMEVKPRVEPIATPAVSPVQSEINASVSPSAPPTVIISPAQPKVTVSVTPLAPASQTSALSGLEQTIQSVLAPAPQAVAPAVTPEKPAVQAPLVNELQTRRDSDHPVLKAPDAMISKKNLVNLEKALEKFSDFKMDKTTQLDNGQPFYKVENSKTPSESFSAYRDKLTTTSTSEDTFKAMLECWKETHPDGALPQINVSTKEAEAAMTAACKAVYQTDNVAHMIQFKEPEAPKPANAQPVASAPIAAETPETPEAGHSTPGLGGSRR